MTERCAVWARNVELDPAGTAPQCDVFVLVEHPLPWPADLADDPFLAGVKTAARARVRDGRSVRLQVLAVEPGAEKRRVIVYAATEPFTGYARVEAAGAPGELVELVAALVATDPQAPAPGPVTDVLVCTHGARDTCCGSFGTRLWRDLGAAGIRVWRTSHTGGHRFAPNAITFPDGNYWAFLDPSLLAGIINRTLPAKVAAAHLRGCAAFTPAIQVADRAVLGERGWEWLACKRFGDQRTANRIGLCFEAPNGDRGGYDVRVTGGRQMPVPDCGADLAAAAKLQTEWRVTRLHSWS